MRRFAPLASLVLLAIALPAAAQDRRTDEHSYAEPTKVKVTDLDLDLGVDFDKRELAGTAILSLDWADGDHDDLVLDTRDLAIAKVEARNGKRRWKDVPFVVAAEDARFGSKLSIDLPRRYEQVRITYKTSPDASGLQWLAPTMTASGKPFMFSQSQAIHARSWVPLQDTPSVRFTYSAHVTTPKDAMALMSADNAPDAVRDGDYSFEMPQAIPSYLLAIAAGDLVFKPISERAGVWTEPQTLDKAVAEFADTEKMIAVTESLYGPYRWGRYDLLILPPSFPFGGMENPRLSFITPTVIAGDKSLVSLIAHELAHSWSGNLVTNATWKDMWLNEGFTSYVENRIVEALYGKERADMEFVNSRNALKVELVDEVPAELQVLALPMRSGSDPEDSMGSVAYDKGAWFLQFLEQRFGREIFDPFLRSWFDTHAFQSADSDQFVAFVKSDLMPKKPGAVTDAEITEWMTAPGIPSYAPQTVSPRFAAVDAARKSWLDRKATAATLDTGKWTTQEWVYFLEGMPKELDPERLVELDQAFRFTGTGNGEIAQRWYPLTVRSEYFEARPSIALFLRKIGRRKLIMPTYEALVATPEGLQWASQVFAMARPGYHPITTGSVEALLAKANAAPAE